jgi:sugar phosphate isomerase/epimerase
MKISVQMYSLREETKKSLDEPLKAVKAAGFDGVELAGMYGLSAAELKEKLDAHGLKVSGAHNGLSEILDNFDKVVSDAAVLGFKDVIVPSVNSEELYSSTAALLERFKKAEALCKKAGLRIGYHNHNFEFKDGKNYLYTLADGVKGLDFETDIFWLKAAGVDFFEVAKRLGDRLTTVHIKEMNAAGVDAPNPPLGTGTSDSLKVLKYAASHKIGWAVLEMEKLDEDYKDYLKSAAKFLSQKF